MKLLWQFILFFLSFSYFALGQKTGTIADLYKVNTAIPDQPAFNLLGQQPSEILRPSSTKALSLITDQFWANNTIIFPEKIAVEIAPYLLIRGSKITTKEWLEPGTGLLSSLRLSIGTDSITGNSKGRSVAFGLRMNLLGQKNEHYLSEAYRKKLLGNAEFLNKLQSDFKTEYLKNNTNLTNVQISDTSDPNYKIFIAEFNKFKEGDPFVNNIKRLDKEDTAFIKEYKELHWNDSRLDLAIAYKGSSPDSLTKNLTGEKWAAWLTGSVKVKSWGQIVISPSGFLDIKDTILNPESNNRITREQYWTFNLPARFYFGTNRVKGFVEGQYKYREINKSNNLLWNAGLEANITDGVWFVISGGIDRNTTANTSQVVTSFSTRFTLPEKFNLLK